MLKTKTSDLFVAGSVVVCSIVLLVALALGLAGRTLVSGGRIVHVRFHDITGIKVSSQVKYGGAPAGVVSGIRILAPRDRNDGSCDLVELALHLDANVPPLTSEAKVSIASDTLLSDKFVLISESSPDAPALAANAVLQGTDPTTFDTLIRNANAVMEGLRHAFGHGADTPTSILSRTEKILTDVESAVGALKPIVAGANAFVGDARDAAGDVRALIAQNREPIQQSVTAIRDASMDLRSFSERADRFLKDQEHPVAATLADFKVTAENLKVTSTYAKFLLNDIARRPSQLIFGGGVSKLPTESQILDSRKPVPVR